MLPIILFCIFLIASCEKEKIPISQDEISQVDLTAKKASEKSKTFYGPARHLGNGVARAVVTMNRDGTPETIGVRFSEKALEKLPQDSHEHIVTLNIPNQAEGMAFNHIDVNYNPQGHPHSDIYGFEHFDFHFYMISEEEKNEPG